MDEGKPTKPKWWSRPRAHSAAAVERDEVGPAADEMAPVDGAPAPAPAGYAADAASGLRGSDTDGDFELERPAGAAPVRAGSDGGSHGSVSGGSVSGGSVSDEVRGGASPSSERGSREPASGEPASAGRPKPLHDPDPYSTPPYGEPGPWAPAPPVQHPGTTPANGTAVPAGTPAHGTAMPGATADRAVPGQAATPPPNSPVGVAAPIHGNAGPAQGTPSPAYGTHIPSPTAPVPPPAQGLPGPHTSHQHGHAQDPQTQGAQPQGPWQHYDPWAAAPLQQNGAAVESTGGRRKRVKRMLVLGAVLIALVSGGVGGAVGAYLERNGGIDDVQLPQAGAEAEGRAPDSVAGIAASALPSVVTLHVRGAEAQGTGTGFVLDERGHILTNHHVVEPAGSNGEITVTFSGGETAKGKVVGSDTGYDLAVVKVTGVSGLKPLPLGNSDNVQVGDPVVAIGAPFDLENTVTSGIISAKERPITAGGESGGGSDVSYVDALQTDAPINPGNSGGPLVDTKARVIGINSAIRSADSGSDLEGSQAGSIGLGFAIPINQGKRVAEELINTGKATHPVIGVTLDMDYAGDGARVGAKGKDGGPAVTQGGPGDKAGLEAGDVVTEVDGQRVHSGEELIVKTRAHRPGDRLELTLERDGKERKVTLVLGSADGG
ncbi:PDZ domain-containing protein [Streptomyces montanus]|uniref:PDZ domain-containing protein n=1 Tax=Streptomyces montanus TaxID=2580423 RepID=A0A5R9FDB7_9ACTN|nr:trypsin-like peptidase domain-containing protein [Streptomyces montanus]TLS41732.1 PDZ domain-containing protein [Streptomyces montanus]